MVTERVKELEVVEDTIKAEAEEEVEEVAMDMAVVGIKKIEMAKGRKGQRKRWNS